MPRRVIGGAVGLLLVSCAAGSGHRARHEVVQQILTPSVQIVVERAGARVRSASGVVLHSDTTPPRSWVLTTRHAVTGLGAADLLFVTPRGRAPRRAAVVVATGRELDLALLRLDGVALSGSVLGGPARLGDEVWVVAYPWGKRLTVVSGVVSQVEPVEGGEDSMGGARMIDASVSYGSSGGGVFEAAEGRLIGLVEGYGTARMNLRGDPKLGVEFPVPGETNVIPAPAIRRFLEAAGYGHLLD